MRSVGGLTLVVTLLGGACKSNDSQAPGGARYDATAVKLGLEQCDRALKTAGEVFSTQVIEYRLDSLLRSDRAEAARPSTRRGHLERPATSRRGMSALANASHALPN
jgi:hypothetical protein